MRGIPADRVVSVLQQVAKHAEGHVRANLLAHGNQRDAHYTEHLP